MLSAIKKILSVWQDILGIKEVFFEVVIFAQRTEAMEWNIQIYIYIENMSSKQSVNYKGLVEITPVAGSSNRKMTSRYQEQNEQGGGTENQIRKRVSTDFIITVMGAFLGGE